MSNVRSKECRTREAESLEQAKQTSHSELKHLHETIARQWRRLAEVIEGGHSNAQFAVHNGRDIPIRDDQTDIVFDSPDVLPIEPLREEISESGHDAARQLSSGAHGITSPQAQISEIDPGAGQLGLLPEWFGSPVEQSSGMHRSAAQPGLCAESAESSNDLISDADHGIVSVSDGLDSSRSADRQRPEAEPGSVSLGFVGESFPYFYEQCWNTLQDSAQSTPPIGVGTEGSQRPDNQVRELGSGTQVDTGPERIASLDDRMSKADDHLPELSPGAEGVASLDQVTVSASADDPISATDPSAVQPAPVVESVQSLDHPISEIDHDIAHLSPDAEMIEGPDHRISKNNPNELRDNPNVEGVKSTVGQIAETDAPGAQRRSTGRVETPFELVLSFWFRGGSRG
jgi:hypothetical protein